MGLAALSSSLVLWVHSYAYLEMFSLGSTGGGVHLISGLGRVSLLLQFPGSGSGASWTSSRWASRPAGFGMRDSFSYERHDYRFATESGNVLPVRSHELTLPFWIIAGGWLLVTLLAGAWARRLRRSQRLAANCCPACGYDLRATPGRCPECGYGLDS